MKKIIFVAILILALVAGVVATPNMLAKGFCNPLDPTCGGGVPTAKTFCNPLDPTCGGGVPVASGFCKPTDPSCGGGVPTI